MLLKSIYIFSFATAQSSEGWGETKEIQDEAGFLADASSSLDSFQKPLSFSEVDCGKHFPSKGINDTCYFLEANTANLLAPLVLYTGNYDLAKETLSEPVDRVRILADTNPNCGFVKSEIKTFAPAMVGPSSIEVSKYHSTKATKNLLLGASTKLATKLPIGKFTLDVSYEYNHHQMEEERAGNGLTFRAPIGETCIPSVMHTFFVCNNFEAKFTIGTLGKSAVTKPKSIAPMLIPITEDGVVKKSHYGCIDYS